MIDGRGSRVVNRGCGSRYRSLRRGRNRTRCATEFAGKRLRSFGKSVKSLVDDTRGIVGRGGTGLLNTFTFSAPLSSLVVRSAAGIGFDNLSLSLFNLDLLINDGGELPGLLDGFFILRTKRGSSGKCTTSSLGNATKPNAQPKRFGGHTSRGTRPGRGGKKGRTTGVGDGGNAVAHRTRD